MMEALLAICEYRQTIIAQKSLNEKNRVYITSTSSLDPSSIRQDIGFWVTPDPYLPENKPLGAFQCSKCEIAGRAQASVIRALVSMDRPSLTA